MDSPGGYLPRHLLTYMMQFVGHGDVQAVRCVSRLFRELVMESRETVLFHVEGGAHGGARLHQLSRTFPMAERLKIVARPPQPFDSVRFSLAAALVPPPRLSSVELHKVQVDAPTLLHLVQMESLRELKCIHVEFVDLGRWKHRSTGIQSLHLSDCQFVSARGVGRAAESKKALSAFLKSFDSVTELTLESMELTDAMLGAYLSQLGSLTSLNLAGSRGFSHRSIARVPKARLKDLVLSACWVLSESMCRVICDVCPSLETLGVYEGELSTVSVDLRGRLSQLKTLDMGYSDGDVSPMDLQRMLSKLKNLSVLNLGGVSAVNDFVMATVGNMKSLKRLDISGCPGLTSAGFKPLSNLEHLEDLTVGWNSKFGDADIIDCLPASLETLDISYASKISDAGLAHLTKLSRLKELKLTSCQCITNDGIRVLSQRGVSVVA
jgi:hypothetical protein